LTILTGALPELTGFHGNIFSGETEFGSLYARQSRLDSKRAEFMRGMTGCPWWSDMVQSHFPRLRGDGAVNLYSMYDVLRRHNPLPIDLSITPSEQLVPPPYIAFQVRPCCDSADRWFVSVSAKRPRLT